MRSPTALLHLRGTIFNLDRLPTFRSAKWIAEYLQKKGIPINEETVRGLAIQRKLPCFFFDENPEPLFLSADLDEWVCGRMIHPQIPEAPAEVSIPSIETMAAANEIPEALRTIEDLHFLPLEMGSSVVYFLCQGSKVVYVGQSTNVNGRIGNHVSVGQKKFDRVFYICVSPGEISKWESYFIRALQPVHNFDKPSPDDEKESTEVVVAESKSSNTTTSSASS